MDHHDTNLDNSGDTPLQSILEHVEITMDGEATVDLKTVVEAFGNRAFGPVMILCGLCMMTPLGAIPGIPPAFGLIVIVFAVQLLFRRPTPWMPNVLRRVKIPATKLIYVKHKTQPVLAKVDAVIRTRLRWATTGPMRVLVSIIAIILALTFFPLGMVPFGVVAPAFIVLLLGLGITARDGIIVLVALSLSAVVFGGVAWLLISKLAG